MKFIYELLKDEKVEWKKLGEVCEIIKGKQLNKENMSEIASYPVINGGIFASGYVEIYNQEANTITISQGGASAGYVNFIESRFWLGAHAYAVIPEKEVLNRYVYHFLKMEQNKLQDKKEGAGIPSISKSSIESLKILIPSLETQEKIVKILDNFTKYVTELQAELQARNKQYNYYRDMLLSEDYLNKISEKFIEDKFVEWKMLGELFEFKNGLNKGKDFFGKGTPIINYLDVYKRNKIYLDDLLGLVETTEDEQKRYSIKRGDVFFTRTSETKEEIGKTSVLLDDVEKGVFSGFVLRARPITELLLPEYCAYCFETYEFRKNVIRYSTYTTRALTNGTTLSNLEIPVPSIEIQNKIVKILDRFQELLSDTKG